MRDAQIIIRLDSAGNFFAEAPGKNGARQKIDLPIDFEAKNPELVSALLEQRDAIRAQERAKLNEVQTQNIAYVTENYGLRTARQIWHNGELAFNRRWKKHLAGELGNATRDARNTNGGSKSSRPSKAIDLLKE